MKTGLILVDLQNDYFPGGAIELVGIREAATKAQELLSFFRTNRQSTFHIQHISRQDNALFFRLDTPGVEIHDRIRPLVDDRIINKRYPNSFRETELLEELNKNRITQLIICGAMSHMCIDATTRAAVDYGFNCVVIQDAYATKDLAFGGKTIAADLVHSSFMAALSSAYARVLSLKQFKESENI